MASTRVFVSFDYDNDSDLKVMLVGQSKLPDSPFEITDVSITVATPGWRDVARRKIKSADVVAVICGQHTDTATGVAAEVKIAQEEGKPYFLLHGRPDKTCKKPTTAKTTDTIYKWTWENLKKLIGGSR